MYTLERLPLRTVGKSKELHRKTRTSKTNTWAAWSRPGKGTHEERIVGSVLKRQADAYTRRVLAAVSS